MNQSKAIFSKRIAIIQVIVGILSTLFGGVWITDTISDIGTSIMGVSIAIDIFFMGGGILLIIVGIKTMKLVNQFREYVAILSMDNKKSISNIAMMKRIDEPIVLKNLQKMIYRRYFANAYIDMNTKSVVFPNQYHSNGYTQAQPPNTQQVSANPVEIQEVAVTCKGCGGVTKLRMNQVGECEYCGTPLKG